MPEGIEQYFKKLAEDAYADLEKGDIHEARQKVLQILAVIKENKIKKQFKEVYDSAEQIIKLFEEANFRKAEELLLRIFRKEEISSEEFEKRKKELIESFRWDENKEVGELLISSWEDLMLLTKKFDVIEIEGIFELLKEKNLISSFQYIIEILKIENLSYMNCKYILLDIFSLNKKKLLNKFSWPYLIAIIEIIFDDNADNIYKTAGFISRIEKIQSVKGDIWPNLLELAKIFAGEKDIDSSFFRKYRKNKSFSIKPHKINKNLHGKINVQIRSGIDLEPKNTVDFVFLMIQNENEVGYEQLFDFIKEVFYYIIRYNEDIFTAVYGRKIKCNFYIDLTITDLRLMVGEEKDKIRYYKSKQYHIKGIAIDNNNKNLEINIDITTLIEAIKNNSLKEFSTDLIHEISHLYDKNVLSGISDDISDILISRVRAEGVATFSEFVYSGKLFFRDNEFKKEINAFQKDRIDSSKKKEFIWFLKGDSTRRYDLGLYMCLEICTHILNNRFYPKRFDLHNDEGYQYGNTYINGYKDVIKNKIHYDYTEVILRILRNTSVKQFFQLYIDYAEKLGHTPIFTKDFVDILI